MKYLKEGRIMASSMCVAGIVSFWIIGPTVLTADLAFMAAHHHPMAAQVAKNGFDRSARPTSPTVEAQAALDLANRPTVVGALLLNP
jgi:hypothetical protein